MRTRAQTRGTTSSRLEISAVSAKFYSMVHCLRIKHKTCFGPKPTTEGDDYVPLCMMVRVSNAEEGKSW